MDAAPSGAVSIFRFPSAWTRSVRTFIYLSAAFRLKLKISRVIKQKLTRLAAWTVLHQMLGGSLGPQSTKQDFSPSPAWDTMALVHLISFTTAAIRPTISQVCTQVCLHLDHVWSFLLEHGGDADMSRVHNNNNKLHVCVRKTWQLNLQTSNVKSKRLQNKPERHISLFLWSSWWTKELP